MINIEANKQNQLGGFRNLLYLAVPLMISEVSAGLMLFVDRLILAHYSVDAMNGAANAGLTSMIFIFSSISMCSISEVFVGQYNGKKEYKKVPIAVWQMIWLSLLLNVVFIPSALFAGEVLIAKSLQKEALPYFKIMLLGGCIYPINAALTGFFIGRGEVKLITVTMILASLLNLVLDLVLIFGIPGWVPSLGTTGAAIATTISQLFQIIVLLAVMLNAKNRQQYATNIIKFDYEIFVACIKFGLPSAINHMLELLAWSVIFYIAGSIGRMYVTALTMGQSMFIMMSFMIDGLNKAVSTIASNLIGAGKKYLINKLWISALWLHTLILAVTFIPLWLVPEIPVSMFDLKDINDPNLISEVILTLRYVWFYIMFDGVAWILAGILTAGGDTKFIMIINIFNSWFFAVLPKYFALVYFQWEASSIWAISSVYAVMNILFFYARYRKDQWIKLDLHNEVSS